MHHRFQGGFTLTELMVVVTLIVAMLMILLPALQAFQQGRVEQAANAQLAADLNNARHQAILNAAPVYVLFFPQLSSLSSRVGEDPETLFPNNATRQRELSQHLGGSSIPANLLLSGQLTSYALYAESSAGDQPASMGSDQERKNKVYLSEWKRLPHGAHFTTRQLQELRRLNDWVEEETDETLKWTSDESGNRFRAPRPRGVDTEYGTSSVDYTADPNNEKWRLSLELPLPYIGFGPRGQLLGISSRLLVDDSQGSPRLDDFRDGFFSIEIATGAVLPPPKQPEDATSYMLEDVDAEEERRGFAKYNRIRLNTVTGRSSSQVCNVYLALRHLDKRRDKKNVLAREDLVGRVTSVLGYMRENHGVGPEPNDVVINYRIRNHPNPLLMEEVSMEKARLFEDLLYREMDRWFRDPNVLGVKKNPIRGLTEEAWRLQLILD